MTMPTISVAEAFQVNELFRGLEFEYNRKRHGSSSPGAPAAR